MANKSFVRTLNHGHFFWTGFLMAINWLSFPHLFCAKKIMLRNFITGFLKLRIGNPVFDLRLNVHSVAGDHEGKQNLDDSRLGSLDGLLGGDLADFGGDRRVGHRQQVRQV